jgi:hypothetical protein
VTLRKNTYYINDNHCRHFHRRFAKNQWWYSSPPIHITNRWWKLGDYHRRLVPRTSGDKLSLQRE